MKRIFALILAAATLVAIPAFAQKSYKLADRSKLGGEGGWDYLTYDSDANRLFITRGTHVMVVDAKT
ncbi:MAG TPA: YncE family protein, partial [Terriglobales bacterium]